MHPHRAAARQAGLEFERAERVSNYGRAAALVFGLGQVTLLGVSPASAAGAATLAALVPPALLLLFSGRAQRAGPSRQFVHAIVATVAETGSVAVLMAAYVSRELWPLALLVPLIAAVRFGFLGAVSAATAASAVLAAIVRYDGNSLTALTFQLGMLWMVALLIGQLARESAQERELLSIARAHEQELAEELAQQALHDPLTGLANRTLLADRLDHDLESSQRTGQPVCLLALDLDGFKPVNDTLGHAAGDTVLVETAARLTSCTRPGDTVARLGGDEFALLLPGTDEEAAARVADRVLQTVRTPTSVGPTPVTVRASIGIALASQTRSATTADQLCAQADRAMYAAKRAGRDRHVLYTADLDDQERGWSARIPLDHVGEVGSGATAEARRPVA